MSPSSQAPGALRRAGPLLVFLAALILLAANLRTGIVVIGPLADGIGEDLRLDGVALGLLTSLPLLCFAALSLFAPRLGERLGLERALLLGLWVLLAGLTLRVPGNYGLMLVGTLMMGAAIAVMNVLTPGLVRQRFPHRVAAVTALYSVVMACGASAAAAFAVPVRDHFGGDWRYPLAASALVALLGALAWLPMLRRRPAQRVLTTTRPTLWRQRDAWVLSLFFGCQSLLFYTLTAWLAKFFVDAGTGEAEAGRLLTLFTLSGMPANFVAPLLFALFRRRRRLTMALMQVLPLAGMVGLLVAPLSAPVLWVVLLGVGQGCMIALGLTLIAVRGADARVSAGLSGMCQSLGYLLSASGPVALGALYDVSGAWLIPMGLLMAITVVQAVSGVYAAEGAPVRADRDAS